ncbi:MAG: ATP-binding protein [Saprospiraceae bacterium]|nr:ATP-binding protein [Saprospiraceae bacterium]
MVSPFKFLNAYDKTDKDIFFGRDKETKELYERIFETNLVLLYGASGTGKTSLINCGLNNRMESTNWLPIFIRRQDNMIASFKSAIKDTIKEKSGGKVNAKESIPKLIHDLYIATFKPIYLIFDQFEELFILGDDSEQDAFFEEIANLLDTETNCKVILSMREEYIAYLSGYEREIPELFDNRLRIEMMSNGYLKDVIIGTAYHFKINLSPTDEDIADAIIDRLKDKKQHIDLANLQVYLDRLYRMDVDRDKNKTDRVFDEQLIELTGNLEDVMDAFLDEQIEVIEKELKEYKNINQKGIPLDILFTLVTDNGTKQAVDVEDIKRQLSRQKQIDESTVDYCIQRFKEMRILRELSE